MGLRSPLTKPMNKACILTKSVDESYETQRIISEGEKLGIEVVPLLYTQMSARIAEKVEIYHDAKKVNFQEYSFALARPSSDPLKNNNFTQLQAFLIQAFHEKNVTFLNRVSLQKWLYLSKLLQQYHLSSAGIPVIDSTYIASKQTIDRYQFPYIIKKILSSRGRNIHKIGSIDDFEKVIAQYGDTRALLFQEFIPTGYDFRTLIIGDRAVGTIKRIPSDSSFLSNISQGGSAEYVPNAVEIEKLALSAARVFDLEYAGIDIMLDSDNIPRVIEVNRYAQFQGFEKVTGINVAGLVIDYLQSQT